MRALFHVIVKEFLQLRRDKKMIPALVVGPIVQLLALGYAANMDVNEIPLLLVDQDRTRRAARSSTGSRAPATSAWSGPRTRRARSSRGSCGARRRSRW